MFVFVFKFKPNSNLKKKSQKKKKIEQMLKMWKNVCTWMVWMFFHVSYITTVLL